LRRFPNLNQVEDAHLHGRATAMSEKRATVLTQERTYMVYHSRARHGSRRGQSHIQAGIVHLPVSVDNL
jgi:hypothetical protein